MNKKKFSANITLKRGFANLPAFGATKNRIHVAVWILPYVISDFFLTQNRKKKDGINTVHASVQRFKA